MMNDQLSKSKWLPPSPHKEVLLELIEKGRAHIEERGHNIPPLLIYEDGGTMELPRFRCVDGKFVAVSGSEPARQTTKYLDVCGTVDELKRILQDEPELAKSDPGHLNQLLEDASNMLARMQTRLEKYQQFARDVGDVLDRIKDLTGPEPARAYEEVEAIRCFIEDRPDEISDEIESLFRSAEGIRDVANKLEQALYKFRDAAIDLGVLYEDIRGRRNWKKRSE